MTKKLKFIRIIVQILFLILTLLSIRLSNTLTAKLTIFSISFFIGTYYCGWICAFGTIQSFIREFGKRYLNQTLVIPEKYNKIMLYFRYVTLFLSLTYITTVADGRKTFLALIAGKPVTYSLIGIMSSFLFLSLFIDRPFCKYICPEGARYGIIGLSRIFTITRNQETCINCNQCTKNCPMGIDVAKVNSLNLPHCISCGECIIKCPKEKTLAIKLRNFKNPSTFIFFALGIYFLYNTINFTIKRFG